MIDRLPFIISTAHLLSFNKKYRPHKVFLGGWRLLSGSEIENIKGDNFEIVEGEENIQCYPLIETAPTQET